MQSCTLIECCFSHFAVSAECSKQFTAHQHPLMYVWCILRYSACTGIHVCMYVRARCYHMMISLLLRSPSIQNALRIPTPNDKLKLLSPAARKLAQKTTPRRSVDHSLRQSYTPSHTPSSSPLVTAKSGGRKKSAGSRPSSSLRPSSGSSTPTPSLLSDNLLNLTN